MINLTRRTALVGAAATALTPLAAGMSALQAAAPMASKQVAGFYRYKVGDIEVTVVTDGARTMPLPDTFVKNVKKEDVSKALSDAFLEPSKMTIVFNPIVVNTGSKLVVIDTGLGPAAYAQSKGAVGQFQTNLAAAGIDPKAVDTVVISHFHVDHINGLLTADNKPAYPNAEVMVPAAEWAFWMSDDNMNKAPDALKGNFKNVRRVFGALGNKVTQYGDNKEVAPGITSVSTPGHTPGHTSHILSSGSAKTMIQADVTNHPALFARNPGWHLMFDMDGPRAEATRRKLYDMCAAEKLMIQGFHYPFPAAGYVEKDGTGYRVIPIQWTPSL
jgi:glyoxylase-like metal-dependent hydrolase (beta-lactamase superfamily II)